MIFTREKIESLESRFRTTFINSLAGFRQAVMLGTKSKSGLPNLAIFNSLIHLGANPALLGLISRPDIVQRDSLQNILETGEYTLNYVHAKDFEKAHQCSARYEKGISEFEKVGLVESYDPNFHPPFVQDAIVKIGMKLEQCIDIPLNGTKLIIGSIVQVEFSDALIGSDGFVSLADAEVLISQGLDAYFIAQSLGRLPYAKP